MPKNTSLLCCLSICALACSCTAPSSSQGRSSATGDLKTYSPAGGERKEQGKTTLGRLVLLNVQSEYEGEVTPEQIASLTKDVQSKISKSISNSRPSVMDINVRIYPNKNPTFNIGTAGEFDKSEIQRLHAVLMQSYNLRTKSRVLGFEFQVINKKG
jgi:hypothetical protein